MDRLHGRSEVSYGKMYLFTVTRACLRTCSFMRLFHYALSVFFSSFLSVCLSVCPSFHTRILRMQRETGCEGLQLISQHISYVLKLVRSIHRGIAHQNLGLRVGMYAFHCVILLVIEMFSSSRSMSFVSVAHTLACLVSVFKMA